MYKICIRYAQDMYKICIRYAQDMGWTIISNEINVGLHKSMC